MDTGQQGVGRHVKDNNILYERTPAWVKSDYDKLLVPCSYILDLLHTEQDSV